MAGIDRVVSFANSKYKICLCEASDTHNLSHRTPGPPPGFSGYEGEFLQTIVEYLGVSFDYIVIDEFGLLLENGSQTGCQGLIQRKEVDIMVCPSFQIIEDYEIAEASPSYTEYQANFVAKIPDLVSRFDALFKIFDYAAFISIGISLLFVSLLFYLLTKRQDSYIAHLLSRFADLVLQEPLIKIKNTLPLEILTTVWIFSAQFITLAGMAVILTALMVPRRMPPVNTKEKLWKAIKAGEYKAATLKITPTMLTIGLEGSPDETLRNIGKFVRDNHYDIYYDETNYLSILQNNTAIATLTMHKKLFIPANYPVILFEESLSQQKLSMCMYIVRSFPLKKKLTKLLQRMIEAGLYNRNENNYVFKKTFSQFANISRETDIGWKPLGIADLQGPIMVLVVGLTCSLICFVCEVLVYNINIRIKEKHFVKRLNRENF